MGPRLPSWQGRQTRSEAALVRAEWRKQPWRVLAGSMCCSFPGGIGTRKEMANPQFLAELRRLAETSRIVATACTGSLLLARTGLLDGRKATSNKRAFQEVKTYAPKVEWIAKARWVEDGKYFTSSGVSAGIDMALAVMAKLCGRETSLQIASRAEYTWYEDNSWDPFAAVAEL
jgi:transcriptional regulator GlxA family with amidase domain